MIISTHHMENHINHKNHNRGSSSFDISEAGSDASLNIPHLNRRNRSVQDLVSEPPVFEPVKHDLTEYANRETATRSAIENNSFGAVVPSEPAPVFQWREEE